MKSPEKRVHVQKAVGTHSFSEEEKVSFTEHINQALKNNEFCQKKLPLDPQSDDLFRVVADGILLWSVEFIYDIPQTITPTVV